MGLCQRLLIQCLEEDILFFCNKPFLVYLLTFIPNFPFSSYFISEQQLHLAT
jgi:hypothetical protein